MRSSEIAGDETTFEFPPEWLRSLRPRRGGVRVASPKLDPQAGARVSERIEAANSAGRPIRSALVNRKSDPDLVREVTAALEGEMTPRGAAGLCILANIEGVQDYGSFADSWIADHGLVFAAEAVAELAWVNGEGARSRDEGCTITTGLDQLYTWPGMAAADRVRALLANADDEIYQHAVTALAELRRTKMQQIVVSYLVPTETAWVDECCQDFASLLSYVHESARTMVFGALSSAEQIAALDLDNRAVWYPAAVTSLATLADGVGTAIVPILLAKLGPDQNQGAETRKPVLGMLSMVPSDEAFTGLLAMINGKNVQPGLLGAMKRFPVRALRLLAEESSASPKNALLVRNLLTGHIRGNPELTADTLPLLPERSQALITELIAQSVPIEAAATEELPGLLVEPPWTRKRTPVKRVTLPGLVPLDETGVKWLPGEREAWLAVRFRDPIVFKDWTVAATRFSAGNLDTYYEIEFFRAGPEDLVGPLLGGWEPEWHWYADIWLKAIVAKHGTAALPVTRRMAEMKPAANCVLLLPLFDAETARLMADWMLRLKSANATARAWFTRHGANAALLLIPDALGEPGPARTAAENALRFLAANAITTAADIVAAAQRYGTDAADAISILMSTDPLENLPTRIPVVGDWADIPVLPQILLRGRERALPDSATRHVLTMLALCSPGDTYAGIAVVRELCDPASLAEFAWALFDAWRANGGPPKEAWALAALGLLGDDETVRRLVPLIKTWPGEGENRKAALGLDVLAQIGTDVALMHLHNISQRVKFRALKLRAQEKIAEIALALDLSEEQLADRLVPDFGLDATGSLTLDFGPRTFTIGFDEQLKPFVTDQDGKQRKDLPAPNSRDDAATAEAARKRFAELKKDVRTVAAHQVLRLESAMVSQRTWSATEFTELLAGHPLLWHIVRRLVWTADIDGKPTGFRVAEDRTLADVHDDALALPADAQVRVAHPVNLADTLSAWSEVFADYEILQPFPQLGRPVLAFAEEELTVGRLTRFEGLTLPVGKLLGLVKRGWDRGEVLDAGVERWISRRIDQDRYLLIDLNPGIAAGMVTELGDQTLNAVWLNRQPGDFWSKQPNSLHFGDLDPVIASELLNDLLWLTDQAK